MQIDKEKQMAFSNVRVIRDSAYGILEKGIEE